MKEAIALLTTHSMEYCEKGNGRKSDGNGTFGADNVKFYYFTQIYYVFTFVKTETSSLRPENI